MQRTKPCHTRQRTVYEKYPCHIDAKKVNTLRYQYKTFDALEKQIQKYLCIIEHMRYAQKKIVRNSE